MDSTRFERIQYTNFPTILRPLSTDPNGISNGDTYFNYLIIQLEFLMEIIG